jgi:hypothetical protein
MSTKSKWRGGNLAFHDGSTHETTGPLAPLVFKDDFLGTTLVAGATEWLAKDIHADATEANVANAEEGVFRLHIGATDAEQEAGLTFNDKLFINLDKKPIVEFVAAVHVLPTLLSELYFGVGNAYVKGRLVAADEGPTVHAFFVFDGSGICTVHTDDTAVDNDAKATGVTVVADAKHVFRIDFTDITDVKFYIDGVGVATSTTFNMSTGTNVVMQPMAFVYKASSAGLGDVDIDSIAVWSNR